MLRFGVCTNTSAAAVAAAGGGGGNDYYDHEEYEEVEEDECEDELDKCVLYIVEPSHTDLFIVLTLKNSMTNLLTSYE